MAGTPRRKDWRVDGRRRDGAQHSPAKKADAERLGRRAFVLTTDEADTQRCAGRFDVILDTLAAPHDYRGVYERCCARAARWSVWASLPEPIQMPAAESDLDGPLRGWLTDGRTA